MIMSDGRFSGQREYDSQERPLNESGLLNWSSTGERKGLVPWILVLFYVFGIPRTFPTICDPHSWK